MELCEQLYKAMKRGTSAKLALLGTQRYGESVIALFAYDVREDDRAQVEIAGAGATADGEDARERDQHTGVHIRSVTIVHSASAQTRTCRSHVTSGRIQPESIRCARVPRRRRAERASSAAWYKVRAILRALGHQKTPSPFVLPLRRHNFFSLYWKRLLPSPSGHPTVVHCLCTVTWPNAAA